MKLSRKKTKRLTGFLQQLIESKLSESGQVLKAVKFSEISFKESPETGRLTISKVIARIQCEITTDNVTASDSYNLIIYGPALFDYSESHGYLIAENQDLHFTKQRARSSAGSALTK